MASHLLRLCKVHRKPVDKSHNWRQTNKKVHWQTECQSLYYDSAKNIGKLWGKKAIIEGKHIKGSTDGLNVSLFTITLQRRKEAVSNGKQTKWPLTDWMIFYSLQNCKRTQKKCGRMANKQIYHWQTEWHSIYGKSAKSIKKNCGKKVLNDRKQTKLQFLEWLNDNVPFTKSKSY